MTCAADGAPVPPSLLTRRTLPDGYAADRDAVASGNRGRAGTPLAGRGGVHGGPRRGHRRPGARAGLHRDGRRAPARRTGAAQRVGPAQGPGHRRAGVRRRPPRRPARRPARGARPHRQGPLHPDAADAAGRRRAGQPAPRRARRRRRPGRDAGRGRRPALGAPGRARRHPLGEPGRTGRVRHDRRRGAARGVLPRRRRAGGCRVAGRDGHRRARRSAATTRRSRPTPACSPRATSSGPTSPWSPRGRATWAPAPAGATRGWPAPTPCTPPTCSAAAAWRRCGCREPTAANGTAASATTAARPTGGRLLTPADVPVTTLPDHDLDVLVRAQLDELVGSARAALTVVEVPADGLLDALAGSPVALTTMGRGLDEDPAPFVAAAAAGAHAAATAQRTSMRSTTKISVSPGLIAAPAPRSP